MFRVGEKVVCICPDEHPRPKGGPKYLEVDTIDRIQEHRGQFWLILERFDRNIGFQSHYFRPLHDDTVKRILKQLNETPIKIK